MAKPDSIAGRDLEAASLPTLAFSEDSALARFKDLRWKHGPFCPRCGGSQIYNFADNRTYKCGACRQRFSVKVGTIFEDSKIGLAAWLSALQLITEGSRGVSAPELAKAVGVSRKTAAHMLQRLQQATRTPSFNRPLEAMDLTANPSKPRPHKTGEVVA